MALVLTSMGLSWNEDIAASRQPLSSQAAVLAAQTVSDENSAFPLQVKFSSPAVRLGQFQELLITTVPEAKLEVVTVYPDGTTNNLQTVLAVADKNGQYRLRFKMADFRNLGLFTTAVTATSGNKVAQAGSQFVLQTWAESLPSANPDYVYPLVP